MHFPAIDVSSMREKAFACGLRTIAQEGGAKFDVIRSYSEMLYNKMPRRQETIYVLYDECCFE